MYELAPDWPSMDISEFFRFEDKKQKIIGLDWFSKARALHFGIAFGWRIDPLVPAGIHILICCCLPCETNYSFAISHNDLFKTKMGFYEYQRLIENQTLERFSKEMPCHHVEQFSQHCHSIWNDSPDALKLEHDIIRPMAVDMFWKQHGLD